MKVERAVESSASKRIFKAAARSWHRMPQFLEVERIQPMSQRLQSTMSSCSHGAFQHWQTWTGFLSCQHKLFVKLCKGRVDCAISWSQQTMWISAKIIMAISTMLPQYSNHSLKEIWCVYKSRRTVQLIQWIIFNSQLILSCKLALDRHQAWFLHQTYPEAKCVFKGEKNAEKWIKTEKKENMNQRNINHVERNWKANTDIWLYTRCMRYSAWTINKQQ